MVDYYYLLRALEYSSSTVSYPLVVILVLVVAYQY